MHLFIFINLYIYIYVDVKKLSDLMVHSHVDANDETYGVPACAERIYIPTQGDAYMDMHANVDMYICIYALIHLFLCKKYE
jgi:hypothetical protein